MLKAATGAVFNVSIVVLEALLGIPPIVVTNKINSIKHFLKLNINSVPGDPLKILVNHITSEQKYSFCTSAIREAMQFLRWKINQDQTSQSGEDFKILMEDRIQDFTQLSGKTCSYSKPVIARYTEVIWQEKMDKHFQLEGFSEAPVISLEKLKFPVGTTRKEETLFLSLFYQNNLCNVFLNQYNSLRFPNPMCECGNGPQDTLHLLTNCNYVSSDLKIALSISVTLEAKPLHNTSQMINNAFWISWSRDKTFFNQCVKLCKVAIRFLRTEIVL